MGSAARAFFLRMARDIDAEEFVPCKSVYQSSYVEPLALVLGKKKRMRKCNKYSFPKHKLKDILVKSENGCGDQSSSLLDDKALFVEVPGPQYGLRQTNVAVEGSVEASIDDIGAGVNLSTSTSYSQGPVQLKFKEVKNLEGIINELNTQWLFNKKHRLWDQVTNQKTMLFLVIGTVFIENCVDLSSNCCTSFGLVAALKGLWKALLKIDKVKQRSLVLPKDTAVAYSVQKLDVDPDSGRLTVPVKRMPKSENEKSRIGAIDSDTEINECRSYYSKYCGNLPSVKQDYLRDALKKLLSKACMPKSEASGEGEDFERRDITDDGSNCWSSDDETSTVPFLRRLKKKAKESRPTTVDTKGKEIEDLMQELGAPALLDVHKEGHVVYGIHSFLESVLSLPPDALPWLRDCANDSDECQEAVKELEELLHCVVDQGEYSVNEEVTKVQTYAALAVLASDETFLNAWRAAYISVLYLCGLPVTSSST